MFQAGQVSFLCTLASQSLLLTLKQLRPWLGFPGFFFSFFALKNKFLKFIQREQRPAGPAPGPSPVTSAAGWRSSVAAAEQGRQPRAL